MRADAGVEWLLSILLGEPAGMHLTTHAGTPPLLESQHTSACVRHAAQAASARSCATRSAGPPARATCTRSSARWTQSTACRMTGCCASPRHLQSASAPSPASTPLAGCASYALPCASTAAPSCHLRASRTWRIRMPPASCTQANATFLALCMKLAYEDWPVVRDIVSHEWRMHDEGAASSGGAGKPRSYLRPRFVKGCSFHHMQPAGARGCCSMPCACGMLACGRRLACGGETRARPAARSLAQHLAAEARSPVLAANGQASTATRSWRTSTSTLTRA